MLILVSLFILYGLQTRKIEMIREQSITYAQNCYSFSGLKLSFVLWTEDQSHNILFLWYPEIIRKKNYFGLLYSEIDKPSERYKTTATILKTFNNNTQNFNKTFDTRIVLVVIYFVMRFDFADTSLHLSPLIWLEIAEQEVRSTICL